MEPILEKTKKLRAAAKTRLTIAANKVIEMCVERLERPNEHELTLAIQNIESRLQAYDETQASYEQLLTTEDLYLEVEQSEAYRNEKLQALAKGKEHLARLISPTDDSDRNSGRSSNSSTHFQQAKLPLIELPKFSGDFTQWQSFWDKFSALIDISDLPTISKFSYLQSLLKGDALSAISGLALTEANYDTACAILRERFGKKERIVFSHIQQLLNLTCSGNTTGDLWSLYDTLQSKIRSLESLGISGDTYGVILTPLVLHRLPSHIRLEWARNGEGRESDLEYLLSFLKSEIARRERSQTFVNPTASSKANQSGKAITHQRATTSALHTANSVGGKATTDQRASVTRKKTGLSLPTDRNENRRTAQHSDLPGGDTLCGVCNGSAGTPHDTANCDSWDALNLADRKEQFFKKGLCFICLGHHKASQCHDNTQCRECGGRHHWLLCKKEQTFVKSADVEVGCMLVTGKEKTFTLLQTATVKCGNNTLNVLFDSGSDRSFISCECAKKMKLECVGQDKVSLALFGQGKPCKPVLRKKFSLPLISENQELLKIVVTESPTICAPIVKRQLPDNIVDILKKNSIGLADGSLLSSDSCHDIDVLIGMDFFWTLVKGNTVTITESLCAQQTVFGWVISGSFDSVESKQTKFENRQFLCRTDIPDQFCHQLWDLEVIGITQEVKGEENTDAEIMLAEFKDSTQYEEGRYTVHLPWKNEQRDKLMNNESLAFRRADNLKKRLNKTPSLEQSYNDVLNDLEQRGIVHEVPTEEIDCEGPVFYLPHRPVIRESSTTTKIRPVFDASMKGANGISLNDCMATGPNLIPCLIETLLRFRRWQYGLTSDIEKAFLQIRITKEDQNVHRFIWDVNGMRRIMRFDRVIFGNASSPFLLNACIKNHLNHFQESRVVNELRQNLYVDDWLTGADTEEEIENMIHVATDIMNKGGFPLSKWGSNSEMVLQQTVKELDVGNGSAVVSPSLKILGMHWDTLDDSFYFRSEPALEGVLITKRLVLSFIARIFDPMGFLNPFTILIKILFQELWRLGLDWDQPLPVEMQDQMTGWIDGFNDICRWKIPRCISIKSWGDSQEKQLLCFSDASEKAYGCCVYLAVKECDQRKVSLVASRVRVAPLKKITLPRLELLGAVLAARLLCFVRKALELPNHTPYLCFSDSTIVLHWIKADPHKWKQFIRNRIHEIQSLTNPANWNHIPGKSNPADLLTRGVSATELTHSNEWLHSPQHLEILDLNPKENVTDVEVCSEKVHTCERVLLNSEFRQEPVMDMTRFSQYPKIIRVMGWILRFIANLKSSISSMKTNKSQTLDSEELHKAKTATLKMVQNESYQEEMKSLHEGKMVPKKSPLYKLSPFLDDEGVIRMKGRLQMSRDYTFDEKHPVVLPKCHFSLVLVRFQHNLLKHAGVPTLMTSLRNNYWIFSLRVLAKKVCKSCAICQRQDSRPCGQDTAPLPSDRIGKAHPFSVIGIDHAGPLYCSDTCDKKHYILLFTCGVTRAVHLELVPSLSLNDFMIAFRKFVARRGVPVTVYSDNAKTFVAASNLVKQFGPNAPIWKFSIPLAPWYGGWWERMVRSTKSALRKSIGRELLTRLEMEAQLSEVEACINSRPLTYVEEHNGPLTPSHFLLGRSSPYSAVEGGRIPSSGEELLILNKENRDTLEKFWNLWSEDYIRNLPSLGNGRSKADLQEGSIVLIREEGKSRLMWPLGRVSKLVKSKDGLTRSVILDTERGQLVRDVRKLHKLEVSGEVSDICRDSAETQETVKCSRFGRQIKPPQRLDI